MSEVKLFDEEMGIDYEKVIREAHDKGKTRGAIEGFLQFEYDLSVNEAKNMVQAVLGKSARSGGTDLSKVVKVVRENYGKVSKKELIEKMVKATGGAYSSMNHMYNYIRFAQEYAKQELEASKK